MEYRTGAGGDQGIWELGNPRIGELENWGIGELENWGFPKFSNSQILQISNSSNPSSITDKILRVSLPSTESAIPDEPRPWSARVAGALTHRNFRLLWFAALGSTIGTWMQSYAQSW